KARAILEACVAATTDHGPQTTDSQTKDEGRKTKQVVPSSVAGRPSSEGEEQSHDSVVSNARFPYYTAQPVTIGAAECLAMRVSYVGELGWEIYVPTEYALHVWDALWAAGRPMGAIAAGTGAMDSL